VTVAYNAPLWLQPDAGPVQAFAPHLRDNPAAQAVALLDQALQQRYNSSSGAPACFEPASPMASVPSPTNSSLALPQQQQQVVFPAVQQAPMSAAAASNSNQKVCWRVTVEATNKPGPVCPSAPRRPTPPVVLVPAVELTNIGLGCLSTTCDNEQACTAGKHRLGELWHSILSDDLREDRAHTPGLDKSAATG
jgi:hypothetical protein